MTKKSLPLFCCIALLTGAVAAKAGVINSISGGTTYSMPTLNDFGPGPQTFSGITWSSTNATGQGGSVFGYTSTYNFAANGDWSNFTPMAGLNCATVNVPSSSLCSPGNSMTFALSSPVTAVGGFINYAPGYGTPVIAVYNSSDTLIEQTTLSFSTGGATNSGMFFGFQESTANIAYFTLSGAYIGITDLTTSNSVPEPATLALFAAGLAGLGLAMALRRRARRN